MRLAAVTSIVGLCLVAAPASAAITTDKPGGMDLEGPTWRLVALGEKNESTLGSARAAVTARFGQGQVSGSSGCNHYQGSYKVEGTQLTVGPLAGTMMACPPPVMEIEDAFRGAFAGGGRFAVENGRLTLTANAGSVLVFQAQPEPSLEGPTWGVTGYNNGRQAVVSPLLHTELTLVFRGGSISGSSGCNSYTASYTRDGDRLTIGPLASTRKACPGTDVMQQEQEFLAALAAAATWSIQDDRLDLRRSDGATAVTARTTAAPPRD
jgi:heat shock protein HslJ